MRGAWVAQSAKHLTLYFGSVMISQFMGLSPLSDSVLKAWSLLGILSLLLSLSFPSLYSFSLKLNKLKNKD